MNTVLLFLVFCLSFLGSGHSLVCNLCARAPKQRLASLRDQKDTSGQGFGKKKEVSEPTSSKSANELKGMNIMSPASSAEVQTSDMVAEADSVFKNPEATSAAPVDMNDAIESSKLFKSTRARQEAILDEKIARLREEEELLATDPSVGAVPEMVADRMIGRIATFFGVPVFGGLAIFVGAFFYSKQTDTVIQPSIIAYATQVPFVLGLLGITYGIMSASWEPDRDGSALGVDEFKTNFARVQEGLKRTRETAELKDDVERDSKKLGR